MQGLKGRFARKLGKPGRGRVVGEAPKVARGQVMQGSVGNQKDFGFFLPGNRKLLQDFK